MKRKDYPIEVNPSLLHQELESIPGMITMMRLDDELVKRAHYQMILFPGQGTRLQLEKGIDDTFEKVDLIMASHDINGKSRDQLTMEKKAVDRASGIAKLGLTDDEIDAIFGG